MAGRLELLTTQKVLKIKGELQEQPGFAPRSPGWEHPRAEPENKARKGWKKTPQLGGCCALTLRAAPFPKLAAGNCSRADASPKAVDISFLLPHGLFCALGQVASLPKWHYCAYIIFVTADW